MNKHDAHMQLYVSNAPKRNLRLSELRRSNRRMEKTGLSVVSSYFTSPVIIKAIKPRE
jgi:hypothetical protein